MELTQNLYAKGHVIFSAFSDLFYANTDICSDYPKDNPV